MKTSDYMNQNTEFDNSDKAGLVKSAMGCEYDYNKDTQEITILGPLTGVSLTKSEFDKDNVILYFEFKSKSGKVQEVRKYIKDPYLAKNVEGALKATCIQFKQIVETFLGRYFTKNDDFEFNNFQELVSGFLGKITIPSEPIANLLVEFKDEESRWINLRIYSQKCAWISRKVEDLDIEKVAMPKMTLFVDNTEETTEEIAVPASSDDTPF